VAEPIVTTGTPYLPVGSQVGQHAVWRLPSGPSAHQIVDIDADFIGWASSELPKHVGHTAGRFAGVHDHCRACRWFEPRIFRERPDPERYLIHYAGVSAVPGEITRCKIEWAYSGEEVVHALATPIPTGGFRFTQPASRVLAQAASFDEEIHDEWIKERARQRG
jgi:hypothetical protein